MNDIAIIHKAVTRVMERYIEENHYKDDFDFSIRILFNNNFAMFNLLMKTGDLKGEVVKSVYPIKYLQEGDEDEVVKGICGMYKVVMSEYIKMQKINDSVMSFTN
jgi:hypothetical protein